MRPPLLLAGLALALLLAPGSGSAQCIDWLAGPLDNGTAPNGADNQVEAVITWDPPDNRPEMLVAAGYFTSIQGVSASYIAALDPATGLWTPLGSGLNGGVHCLAVYNGELVAGGDFTQAGGTDAHYVARYDGATWRPLDNGINPEGLNGIVFAMTVYNGALVVAGSFSATSGGGHIHQRIASWTDDATGFQSLGIGVACNGGSCLGQVNCLAQWNGLLIAGGNFTYAGNQPAPYLASWNGSAWQALPGGQLNGEVTSLQPYLGELVIGGRFTQVFSPTVQVNHVVRWNGSTFSPLGTGVNDDVTGLGYYNGSLVATGGFGTAGGSPATGIAAWNGSSWQALGSGLSATQYSPALYPFGNELVAGGGFTVAGGQTANRLARWNGATWSSFGGGSAAYVFAMTPFYGQLVAGGSFTQSVSSGATATNIAGWNGTKLSAFGTGLNGSVFALESFKYPGFNGDYELIAGGLFTVAGGVAATRIARWDVDPIQGFPPPAWQAMGAGFNSAVYAIRRFNSATYAGGAFTFSSSTVNYVARWNETTDVWEAVGGGMNGAVRAFEVYGGALYAGGDFTTAGGVATGGLARWNGSAWSAVGGNFVGQVHSLEVHAGVLVIGGQFPGISGSPNLAWYDGTNYGVFGSGGTNGRVQEVFSTGARLYVAGEFSAAGGMPAAHVAYWDGSWHEAAGGTDDLVLALGSQGGEVHAGGYFLNAGTGPAVSSPRWSRFAESGIPFIASQPPSRSASPGQNVSFSAPPAPGYTGLAFQWYRFDAPLADGPTGTGSTIGGATSPTLVISNISHTDWGSYRMVLTSACGNDTSSVATLSLTGSVGVEDGALATVFEAIGPNPARGPSNLAFSLAREGEVRVDVLDVTGRRVRGMHVGRLPAGRHSLAWDARDDEGQRARPGLYFVRLGVDGAVVGMRRLAMVH